MHDPHNGRRVGRVVGLWRYLVKSMAGESLAHVDVSWHGLAGDRRWAFVRSDVPRSGFPWLTLRECVSMMDYHPRFTDAEQPDKSPTVVQAPSGIAFDIADPALAAEIRPGGLRVIKQDRGVFDTFPISLVTTQSIAQIGETVGEPLDVRRFRLNILVEATDAAPFPEDDWVGRVLRVGGMRMRIDKRDGRCVIITIDPATKHRNAEILRLVARDRQGCIGVYGSTVAPGRIAVDDPVVIECSG